MIEKDGEHVKEKKIISRLEHLNVNIYCNRKWRNGFIGDLILKKIGTKMWERERQNA